MHRRHQRKALIVLVYCSVILFTFYTVYNDWFLKGSRAPNYTNNASVNHFLSSLRIQEWKTSKINSSIPTILLWTPFFGHYEFYYYGIWPDTLTNCPAKCEFTTDKLNLMSSDAVVFHIRDIDSVPVPSVRHPDQVWIFFNREAPTNTNVDLTKYSTIFNWTATYRLDSDVYFPYGVTIRKKHDSDQSKSTTSDSDKRTRTIGTTKPGSYLTQAKIQSLIFKPKFVAWIVSNCETHSNRETFVNDLRQHIDIDIFGKCGTFACPTDRDCYRHVASEYKFYLSFENSLCTDYVTEKYFEALRNDLLPIVYGRANYSHISPPYSFIDVTNFNSSKDLANYLLYLNSNEEEYLKYFKWKEDYTVIQSPRSGWCALCEKLSVHINSENKVHRNYENIGKWWNSRQYKFDKLPRAPNSMFHLQSHREDSACLPVPVFHSESWYSKLKKIFL